MVIRYKCNWAKKVTCRTAYSGHQKLWDCLALTFPPTYIASILICCDHLFPFINEDNLSSSLRYKPFLVPWNHMYLLGSYVHRMHHPTLWPQGHDTKTCFSHLKQVKVPEASSSQNGSQPNQAKPVHFC
jgi:hypothetical protein